MRAKLTTLCLIAATPGIAAPSFTPAPLPAHEYGGGWEHFVGGGVAAFDCDGDRLPELYAAGGANAAQLFRNRTPHKGGALSYQADTPASLALTGVTGAYPLDIDGDQVMDLAIIRAGEDLLLQGQGDCNFSAFETLEFQSGDHWSTAFSATFEPGQTLPTLAIGTYVDRTNPKGPFGTCDATLLYRPNGDHYNAPQRLEPGYCALSMLFTDWARTGHADLRISNDRHYYVKGGQEQMWAMETTPRLYGPEDGWRSYMLWGMGIASRDINGDGFSDVLLTSMGDQKLQYFDPASHGPAYSDATYARGTSAHRPHTGPDGRPSTGWHAAFGDVDNDGRDDIFITKGNVEQMPDAAMQDPNNLLMQDGQGRFSEAAEAAGIATFERSRGAVMADLNLDGQLDLAVVNRRAPMELYQNTTEETGHYLLVSLIGKGSNTQAIGAHVELRSDGKNWVQEVTVGGGHAGGYVGALHFGLGTLETVELRVIWPDQSASPWTEVTVDQHVELSPVTGPSHVN